jgi:hypothetical protein
MKSACQPNGLGCDVRAFPAMQATETMLSMTRIDIAALQKAYAETTNQRGWPDHRPSEWSRPRPGAADEGMREDIRCAADARAFLARGLART